MTDRFAALGVTALIAILVPLRSSATPSCLRITRAGMAVQGDVKICPGRYRIADPSEQGVLVVAGSGTRLDLTGVIIESGDSVPDRFVGYGVLTRGVDDVLVRGGTVRGYRYNVFVDGGRGHRISGVTASGSRRTLLLSTADRYDERDWLDIAQPDSFQTYGSGVLVKGAIGATITGVTARDGQNGIGLVGTRDSYVADNDVSHNSGWGLHLWKSAHNTIVRNRADHNVRCEGKTYSRGCDSAALLLREQSDSNLIGDNDLSHSGDGFFLSGQPPALQPSVGNVVVRNNSTGALHNAFEATYSWNNSFLDNRADSSAYGFWLGYSTGSTLRGNTVIAAREAGVAVEHGSDNVLASNVIIGGKVGIWLFAPRREGPESRGYRIDDNVVAKTDRGVVLERTTRAKVRGNLFDGVGDGLVVDADGQATVVADNVFLRASRNFILAVELDATGNYWGAASAAATASKVTGRVTLDRWRPASAAGY
jgi:parallel beta-helix repeat protein